MLARIGHPFARGEPVYDVTFENVQAGERTSHLFRLANLHGGLVVGTGDLSELALGWCTYGVGDQMSHYNVNASVPKTLIQHLVRWSIASGRVDAPTAAVLQSILDTAISPELVPEPRATGEAVQRTEDVIGPFDLQDFHLYYITRFGFRPSKVAYLAHHAWRDVAAGRLAGRPAGGGAARLRPRHHQALARGLPRALLRAEPVQAVGDAERPEGRHRRIALAARRLARAERRQRAGLDRRARARSACDAAQRQLAPRMARLNRRGNRGCGAAGGLPAMSSPLSCSYLARPLYQSESWRPSGGRSSTGGPRSGFSSAASVRRS